MDHRLHNGSVLAYIGDSVLEVEVRKRLVLTMRLTHSGELMTESVKYVSAKAHSAFVKYALEENVFSEEELVYFRRGKNVKEHRTLKNASKKEHSLSTAFEAVIGYLYLINNIERLEEILQVFFKFIERR